MKKNILLVVMCFFLVLSLSGCGEKEQPPKSEEQKSSETLKEEPQQGPGEAAQEGMEETDTTE